MDSKPVGAKEDLESRETVESPPRTQTTVGISTQASKYISALTSEDPETDPEEEQPRPFSLERFACVRPSRAPSRSGFISRSVSTSSAISRLPSRDSSVVSILPPDAATTVQTGSSDTRKSNKRGRKALPPSRAVASISDRDMARILRCVGCNLAWTTRKSAVQKMKHIESCARKAGLTDETVEVLLKQELEKTPLDPSAESKGKAKGQELNEPKTLLGEKIVDEGMKRKRRPPVEGTVRELADTRENILERARRLLHSTVGATAHAGTSGEHEHGFEDGEEEEDTRPPLTQPFAESALAQRFRPARSLLSQAATQMRPPASFGLDDAQELLDGSPSTQPFGESALARRFGAKTREFDDSKSPPYVPDANVDIDPSWLEDLEPDYDDDVFRYLPDPALHKENSVSQNVHRALQL